MVASLVITMIIVRVANQKYTVAAKTVKAYISTEMIPAHTRISANQVKEIQAPASIEGLATAVKDKYLTCDLPPGVFVYQNMITENGGLPAGFVSINVKVDQASSGSAISGDMVNVFASSDKPNTPADPLVSNIRVIAARSSNGNIIGGATSGGVLGNAAPVNNVASVIELEVPAEKAAAVIGAAKSPGVYLARVK